MPPLKLKDNRLLLEGYLSASKPPPLPPTPPHTPSRLLISPLFPTSPGDRQKCSWAWRETQSRLRDFPEQTAEEDKEEP